VVAVRASIQEVREKQGIVHHADAWTYSPGNPGLFGMSAVIDADKFAAACEALLAEIEKMKNAPVAAAELSKAVKQFIAGTLSSRKTMQGQAHDLGGSWLAANDLNFSERYLAAVKRITPADLQEWRATISHRKTATLFALLPNGATPKTSFETETGSDHPIQKICFAERTAIAGKRRIIACHSWSSARCFRARPLSETTANNGITQLMSKLLLKGTTNRSAEQLANEIESVRWQHRQLRRTTFWCDAEVMSSDLETGWVSS